MTLVVAIQLTLIVRPLITVVGKAMDVLPVVFPQQTHNARTNKGVSGIIQPVLMIPVVYYHPCLHVR
jgi:hypothetical protein